MSTPHRGLPPPSAMALPDPSRHAPTSSLGQPLGSMPNPPNQWQGQEDSMRHWLVAKAEEDKRKQEEERTRQESYRLEQRRIEQSMLREALQAGVPPPIVPMIYAGIGGANLSNMSVDWLQQYAAQLQQHQQQQQQQQQIERQTSPELRRETRLIGQMPAYAAPPHPGQQVISQQPEPAPSNAPLQTTFSAYPPAPPRASHGGVPRSATHTQLPRLTTNEMYVHQPVQTGPGSAHPLQQSQTLQQDAPTSSPSIYFHHWHPPNESKNPPQTPASKGEREPTSAHPGSHLSEGGEYKDSPRKRKAQGGHHANPPPSAGQAYTSPSFSTASSTSRKGGGHQRSRSNVSARGSESRPSSRRGLEPTAPSTQYESERMSEERRSREIVHPRDESSRRPSTEASRDARVPRPLPDERRDERR